MCVASLRLGPLAFPKSPLPLLPDAPLPLLPAPVPGLASLAARLLSHAKRPGPLSSLLLSALLSLFPSRPSPAFSSLLRVASSSVSPPDPGEPFPVSPGAPVSRRLRVNRSG